MIKVSVFYPAKEGGKFDFDYYFNIHMPMVMQQLATTLRGVSADYGMSGSRDRNHGTLQWRICSLIR